MGVLMYSSWYDWLKMYSLLSTSYLTLIRFVTRTSIILSVMIYKLMCEVDHTREHDALVVQGGSVLGWGVVRAVRELGVAEYTSCAPSALILSPCRHMFRCWPEESPAHWGGSDDPTEGGRAGGGMAGGGLPLNFQHRSVQDRMSTSFSPSCSYPPCWRQPSPQLKSSSDRIGGQNDTCNARHITPYIILPQ